MKIVRSVSLSEDLWERVEKARGRESRSGFMERVLDGVLGSSAPVAPVAPKSAKSRVVEPDEDLLGIYMCPEERCFQTAVKPGVCPSHRSRRMTRTGGAR